MTFANKINFKTDGNEAELQSVLKKTSTVKEEYAIYKYTKSKIKNGWELPITETNYQKMLNNETIKPI